MPERVRDGAPVGDLWTIGHWACPPQLVLDTLAPAAIEVLVDVRRTPASRRSPHFNADQLPAWLAAGGIEYQHLPALAGRRPKAKDVDPAVNAGWQNSSFRNYADYTLSTEFEAGLEQLADLARRRHVAIMCGEPMPWRCHRLLISNTLTARGWRVVHLRAGGQPQEHRLGQWGALPVVGADGVVTYPPETPDPAAASY